MRASRVHLQVSTFPCLPSRFGAEGLAAIVDVARLRANKGVRPRADPGRLIKAGQKAQGGWGVGGGVATARQCRNES